MEPDQLILEPSDGVVSDHHSKSVDDQIEAHVDDVAIAASVPVGRRRGRDKNESAMALPSFIWDYFVKDASGKFVICTLCPAQTTRFAYSGGTSTMNRHLRKKHQKYAPGKSPADYEYPKAITRRHFQSQPSSAHASTSTLLVSEPAGLLSPSEPLGTKQRHQLLELRTARRRAASGNGAAKRRKGALDPTDQPSVVGTEFDPSGFVTLSGNSSMATSTALQFPAAFELNDAVIDSMAGVGVDQRFFDYSTPPGACITGTTGVARGRRYCGLIGGGNSVNNGNNMANTAASQKILTHRLLRYLIAQYEPLDVSHMGAELSMLLFGGSTEWPSPGLNFGYGSGFGFGNGPAFKLPSEDTIKLALANLYYSQREILKEVIADVDILSLSLNNWTSAFGQNVLTVTGHWISRGFRRRDCVLEVYVLPLDERVNTIALLRDVMDKWEIPSSKVAALTMRPQTPTTNTCHDEHLNTQRTVADAQAEARSEANAIHSEYPGLAVVRCFVEELEAAVSSGLQQCVELTRRCRTYVSYFIQNPSEYQIFLALQRSIGEETSIASTQTASIGATADGVCVSTGENSHITMGDDLDSVKEGHPSHEASSSSNEMTGGPSSSTNNTMSSEYAGEALPVICDFDNRWNSTTEMMCRIVQLQPMLQRYKMGLESDTNPARRPMQLRFVCCELSTDEWTTLKQLARLLERIEGLVHVSPLAYPGLSIVYPLLHSLKKHLDDAATWVTDPLVATVRHTIANHLDINLCSSGQAPSSPYLSCLLDPRFKTLPFLSTVEKERLLEALYMLLRVHDKDNSINENQHQEDSVVGKDKQERSGKASSHGVANRKTAALLHEFFPVEEPANELEKLKTQVQQYLDSPSVPATDDTEHDPLEWWSRYQRLFPALARLAKKYLCISAVSTPFQEAFTNYGQLMREKKARLDIEVAAQVLFCRSVSRIPEIERIGV